MPHVVTDNGQHGLQACCLTAARFYYSGNVLNGNNGGNANPQAGTVGIQTGTNVCGGDTICP